MISDLNKLNDHFQKNAQYDTQGTHRKAGIVEAFFYNILPGAI